MQMIERLVNHDLPSGVPGGLIQRTQRVKAGLKSYDVHLTVADLDACCRVLGPLIGSRKALIVTTPTVFRLYGEEIVSRLRHKSDAVSFMVLECTEAKKTIDQVTCVCDRAIEIGLDR